ncbi:MAG: hypothetical protein FD152_685 [Xanthobacteraceae bacterium]|nr:MAG: hypothetical protein FD152_685 [Xanthobacteraceae bacterium]
MKTDYLVARNAHIRDLENALASYRGVIEDPDFLLEKDEDAYKLLRRAPKIQQALRHRRQLVAGRSWRLEPASSSDDDRQAAAIVARLLGGLQGFQASRAALAAACLNGLTVARIFGQWQFRDFGGGARRWWVPGRLGPIDKQRVQLTRPEPDGDLQWQIRDVEGQTWMPMDRPDAYVFHRYEDDEAGLGYGLGLGEALWVIWRPWTIVLQYTLQHAERWGHGVVEVGVDTQGAGAIKTDGSQKTNAEIADEWLTRSSS